MLVSEYFAFLLSVLDRHEQFKFEQTECGCLDPPSFAISITTASEPGVCAYSCISEHECVGFIYSLDSSCSLLNYVVPEWRCYANRSPCWRYVEL